MSLAGIPKPTAYTAVGDLIDLHIKDARFAQASSYYIRLPSGTMSGTRTHNLPIISRTLRPLELPPYMVLVTGIEPV